jgi:hypothetical protein
MVESWGNLNRDMAGEVGEETEEHSISTKRVTVKA